MYKTISNGFTRTTRYFDSKEKCREYVRKAYFSQDIYILENNEWIYIGSQIF